MVRLDTIESWHFLAEQRLAHLGELFETGRWRRYHTEAAFLENLREAKSAVESWRLLAANKVSPVPPQRQCAKPIRESPEPSEDKVLERRFDISVVQQRYPVLYNRP